MKTVEVYQTVLAPDVKCSQPLFVSHFNNAQSEILNLYSEKYTANADTHISDILAMGDISNLRDEYFSAVCDRVKYLVTGDERYDAMFNNRVAAAYINVWNKLSKNTNMRMADWR